MTCLAGIVILLLTLSNIETGQADVLTFLARNSDVEVTRADSGCLYWIAILVQTLIGLGLIAFGVVFDRALGMSVLGMVPAGM